MAALKEAGVCGKQTALRLDPTIHPLRATPRLSALRYRGQ